MAGARRDLSAEAVMGIFLHGLKEEIRAELKVNQFRSLNALMDKTLELEERNVAWRGAGLVFGPKVGSSAKPPMSYRAPNLLRNGPGPTNTFYGERRGLVGVKTGVEKKRPKPKKLSRDEWQERQRKGLCFKCRERWGRDQLCPMGGLQLLLVAKDEEAGDE